MTPVTEGRKASAEPEHRERRASFGRGPVQYSVFRTVVAPCDPVSRDDASSKNSSLFAVDVDGVDDDVVPCKDSGALRDTSLQTVADGDLCRSVGLLELPIRRSL